MKEKIIVALDVDSLEKAEDIVSILGDKVGAFKVGKLIIHNMWPSSY